MSQRPVASISLDLDNKWSYLKTHGDPAWQGYPSYLDAVVPRIVEFLRDRRLETTVFVVGRDAALEKNRDALARLSEAGHSIGNHSFDHEPWLHLYTREQLIDELERAEESIERATGVRPKGFRGPGYSISPALLEVLAERGYEYDASVFPNVLNPLARAYFLATARLSPEERERRKALFGTLRDARRPIDAFWWTLERGRLLEIPVTTMPLFRVPIHMTYVHYLGKYSKTAAAAYIRAAVRLCRLTGTELSFLLHPSDFLGSEDDADMRFFPAMDVPYERKKAVLHDAFDVLQAAFEVVSLERHAARIAAGRKLAELEPARA